MKIIEYEYSKLCFKADIIEPLNANDAFIVHTPEGSFQITKEDFHNVYPKTPTKALIFLK